MADWRRFEEEAGDLAAAVKARFQASKHHVLATIRRDGSPRVSGTEVLFLGSDLLLGSMPGAVKARDLQRDGRFALHANPNDPSMREGDAKVSGFAKETFAEPLLAAAARATGVSPPFHLFRLELDEAVLTSLAPESGELLIETWRPGRPRLRFTRRHDEPSAQRRRG